MITSFGTWSELWIAGYRNSEVDGPPQFFTTLQQAKNWAEQHVNRVKDVSIYRCELQWHLVVDEPRWVQVNLRPTDPTAGGRDG